MFGSRAVMNAKAYSDVDLVIDAGKILSLQQMARLVDVFQESSVPYKVDCVDWHNVSDAFRENIQSQMKQIDF
jgi:predicted nucleotidyltransferase